MRFTPIALAAAAAQGALARPSNPAKAFTCGAPEPDAEHIKISQKFAIQEAQAFAIAAESGNFTTQAVTTVDTYFHVVASSTSLSGGYVTVSHPPPLPLPDHLSN